ncbi:hypothetical protein STEG23_021907, partial [Scotinomys teguina]
HLCSSICRHVFCGLPGHFYIFLLSSLAGHFFLFFSPLDPPLPLSLSRLPGLLANQYFIDTWPSSTHHLDIKTDVTPLRRGQDSSLKNWEPDVPALLVPGSWRLELDRRNWSALYLPWTLYPFPSSDSRVQACAAVWRMPKELESGSHESPDDPASTAQTLELLCHLDNGAHGNVACVVWEPMGDGKKVISLADSHILLWDLQASSSQAVLASSAALEGRGQLRFTAGRWSPHHNCTQVATASDTTLRGWDTRSMSQIYCIENAHGQLVRDLDFNPNKQYYLASCGDDCKVKFWDTRNVTEPVKTLEEHSHWVWSVRYNHSHDQLVLTGSSDSRVILSNMVSISSEPFGHLVDDDDVSDPEEHHAEKSKEPLQDNVIATYEEHEDSVYAVDWASADPWLFASLSYDGRLVINRVPRALKYHILL